MINKRDNVKRLIEPSTFVAVFGFKSECDVFNLETADEEFLQGAPL